MAPAAPEAAAAEKVRAGEKRNVEHVADSLGGGRLARNKKQKKQKMKTETKAGGADGQVKQEAEEGPRTVAGASRAQRKKRSLRKADAAAEAAAAAAAFEDEFATALADFDAAGQELDRAVDAAATGGTGAKAGAATKTLEHRRRKTVAGKQPLMPTAGSVGRRRGKRRAASSV
eukprot:SAG22_NODE_490_length_9834_cov_7.723780_11_plen_174_part_00